MPDDSKAQSLLRNPNTLTMVRIVASPIIVVLMAFPLHPVRCFFASLVFTIAAITDYFDGHFARKYGQVSDFGKAMDPLADKFLMTAAFVMLTWQGLIPGWAVCVIVGRELGITGMRNILVEKGQDISASKLGKWKTGFQIAACIGLLLHYPLLGLLPSHEIGLVLFWIAVVFTVWSGADYFIKARKELGL